MKPEFFKDKLIARLGSQVALVYEACWCWADDGGVARIEPDLLKGDAFTRWPEYSTVVITDCLVKLHEAGRIVPYAVGDELYAEIPTLKKHSPISHPSKFRLPRGGQEVTSIRDWVSGQYTPEALRKPSSPVVPLPLPVAVAMTTTTSLAAPEIVSPAESDLFEYLPPESHEALTGILRAAQIRRSSVAAAIRGIAPGGVQEAHSWQDVGLALLDLFAAKDPTFEPRRFRVFCRKIAEDKQRQPTGRGSLTPAEQMRQGAKERDVA